MGNGLRGRHKDSDAKNKIKLGDVRGDVRGGRVMQGLVIWDMATDEAT